MPSGKRTGKTGFAAPLWLAGLACVLAAQPAAGSAADEFFQAYVVLGEEGQGIARAVSSSSQCPEITVDSAAPARMRLRVERTDEFPVSVCEFPLPRGARKAAVAGRALPVPLADPKHIVVIGDTGCSVPYHIALQTCDSAEKWPLASIGEAASGWHPDLIIHVGDIIYRESPCMPWNQACHLEVWKEDFFKPMRKLLDAAPLVMVRGNHELSRRAGEGWFRFLDPRPYGYSQPCGDLAFDRDFTPPYAVPIAPDTQLIVFDSSAAARSPYAPEDEAFKRYACELKQVDALAKRKPHNIFLSHHPVLEVAHQGVKSLQSVMSALHGEQLFGPNIDLAMHGHVHLFEAVGFSSGQPPVFVGGNSGAKLDNPVPASAQHASPAPGAVVDEQEFFSRAEFGYLTMESTASGWQFTERNPHGQPLLRCGVADRKMHCAEAAPGQ